MKITAIEEYGLRCMILLARNNAPMSLPEISDAEGLSIPYAAKLLGILRKADLVSAERGRNGGYRLVTLWPDGRVSYRWRVVAFPQSL